MMDACACQCKKAKRKNRNHPYKKEEGHNCILCYDGNPKSKIKEGRNMNLESGLHEVKFHYASCYYSEGKFKDIIDAGEINKDSNGDIIDDLGKRFKYRCPYENCSKNHGRRVLMGYKEYCIHCAAIHNQLEAVMKNDTRPGIEEVRKAIVHDRRVQGERYEPMPGVICEEVHTCLLCNGENSEGKHLSFDSNKISSTRYHYACCYYDSGVYLKMYPPGNKNEDKEGKPLDLLGQKVKYKCGMMGCSMKRKMGYKEYCVHNASEHGGVLTVMTNNDNQDIKKVAKKLEITFNPFSLLKFKR